MAPCAGPRRRGTAAAAGAITFLLTGCAAADVLGAKGASVAPASITQYSPAVALESAATAMTTAAAVRFDFEETFKVGDRVGEWVAHGAMDPSNHALTMSYKIRDGAERDWLTLRETVVDERVYVQHPEIRGWSRFTAAQAVDAGLDPSGSDPLWTEGLLEVIKDEARFVGRETVNGVETMKYTGTAEGDAAEGEWNDIGLTTIDFTVHLSDDQLPIRIEAKASGTDEVEGREVPTSIDLTMNYREWGEVVSIRAPKKSVSAKDSGLLDAWREDGDAGAVDGDTV